MTFEYPPFIMGGAGIYAENITKYIANLNHQITVFTPKVGELKRENQQNINFVEIEVNNRLGFKALQFWLKLPKIMKQFKDNFDLIHINGISYCCWKKKLLSVPHVLTIHHSVIDAIQFNKTNSMARIMDMESENSFLIPLIEKRCVKSADIIIADSEFTRTQIIKHYKLSSKKVKKIYIGNGKLNRDFSKTILIKFKKQIGIPDKPVILFVGRLDDRRKGLDILLKSFSKVLEHLDIILVVVGSGNQFYWQEMSKKLKILKNVIFTGFLDDVQLNKLYSISNVYICPSRLEGFGLTILEAMSYNKPIIASNTGSIPELVTNGKNGILIDSEDHIALSEAILELMKDEVTMKHMGEVNGRYIKKFDWNVAAENTIGVYNLLRGG